MLLGVCGRKGGGGGGESTSNCGPTTTPRAPWVPSWPASLQRLNGTEPKFQISSQKSVIVDLRLDIAAFCLLRENGLQITVITFVNNIDSRESCGLTFCPTSKLFSNIPPKVIVGLSNFLSYKSKVKVMARVCATV